MPSQPTFPSDFRALKSLEGKYKGKTTRPIDQSKLRVKVRPTARKQQEVKTVPMPSASGTLRTIGGIAANAPGALADLAVSVPKAAYDYARTTSPSGVLRDVKSAASDFANFVRENPGEAFVETVAGTPKAAGEMLREATLARDAGDEERAAQIEKLAVPMLLGALIPGGRAAKGAGKVAKAEERALLKKEASLAAKGEETAIAKPTGSKPAATAPSKPKTEKPFAAKTEGEKSLAAKPTKKKAEAKPVTPPNPVQVIAEEYSPEIARRTRDFVDADAGLDQWREVAANLQGTQSNRPYQPENDLAFRDFDLGTYGMRKTIDQPRLFDLDVERQRWSPEPDTNTLYLQDLVGRPIMTGMADRTPSGTTITRIGPTELDIPVREHGGQDFMLDYPHSWGVSTKTMGSNFMNTARRLKQEYGVNPIWMPWRMQGSGSDFSKTTGETIMSHANSALGRDTRNAIDRFIKDNYIPDFAGIEDPRGYLQFGELAGPQRKAMETALSNQFAQEGALSLPLTRALITDPNQLNRKAFHLQNVAEIDPDAEVVFKPLNPTYHYNTPGAYEGTLEPGLQDSLNVAELIAPTLRAKYSDLGDLSVFRGQYAPLSPENFADQMAQYEDLKAAFDARVAAGDKKAKPPRKPVPIGGTNKFMQSVFATGFLNDKAAQELYDKLVASGARIK